MLCLLVLTILLSPSVSDLIRLDGAPLGEGLPAGWKVRRVSGSPSPLFSVREQDGRRMVRVEGMAAAWAHRQLGSPIHPGEGILRWSWRVLQLPEGADIRLPHKDDAALRVYVVFGKNSRLLARGNRVIFYTWGNAEPDGLILKGFVSEKIRIVRVAGAMEADGEWREQEAEPFKDYQRFWNREPPAISAVGLMQDTDMTGGKAISELRLLAWETR